MLSYIGNSRYCYANSVSMLLATIDEQIPPGQIEVLTGVGLGAILVEAGADTLLFFNNLASLPDKGINKALAVLGFECAEKWSQNDHGAPLAELQADLAVAPVLLGPLDMGYLDYNPHHEDLAGADHYVVAFAMDDKGLYLHDPEGFPYALLAAEQVALAWKAERVFYRRGFYRSWTLPRRVTSISQAELYEQVRKHVKNVYEETEQYALFDNRVIGSAAIRVLADQATRQALSQRQKGHLVHFSLPLGARRAHDFAAFFADYDPDLASLKRQQAQIFGACYSAAAVQDWVRMGGLLFELADAEDAFQAMVLAD